MGLCLTGPDSKGNQEIDQNSSKLPNIASRITLTYPLIFPLKGLIRKNIKILGKLTHNRKKNNSTIMTPMLSKENKAFLTNIRPK